MTAPSVFAALVADVAALLAAAPALAGGFVKSGRAFPLPAEKSAGIFVRPLRAPGNAPFASDGRVDWNLELAVVCVARAAEGGSAMDAVDALLGAVWERLATAPAPEAADGWIVSPAIAWDFDETDTAVGAAELRLRVRVRTGSSLRASD